MSNTIETEKNTVIDIKISIRYCNRGGIDIAGFDSFFDIGTEIEEFEIRVVSFCKGRFLQSGAFFTIWWANFAIEIVKNAQLQNSPTQLQGRAKPNFWTRNRNQWVLKGNFRTTKSKPICMNGIIQNQNRNQFLINKKFEIKIKIKMQKAVLFKTETETNIRSYLVTMTSYFQFPMPNYGQRLTKQSEYKDFISK